MAAAGVLPAASPPSAATIRIATFNASLNRDTEGGLRAAVSTPDDPQIRAVATIIRIVRPDILLLQEFDYDADGVALRDFQRNYLARAAEGPAPIEFAYSFFAESNTGIPSGFDLDNDGKVGGGGDALGFGAFPGQYGMVVLSKFPIDRARVRTFRKFLWRDMPGALLPDRLETPAPADWYSAAELAVLPLSSKSHWDIPVRVGSKTLRLLASHPTPPAFDGPEDRNGLRNHDEIRFWKDYLSGEARHIRDDTGRRGGFDGRSFVIMGDLNSDPQDGDSRRDSIRALIAHPHVAGAHVPRSAGAVEASKAQGGANEGHRGTDSDTADFNDRVAGNLRVDYLLPSKDLSVCGAGVFWPTSTGQDAHLVWGTPPPGSDHRLVWLDITAGAARCPPDSDRKASDPAHPGR
jgi:endonuclease/exonuclease/phosphatase family metal-dependent hydrolase